MTKRRRSRARQRGFTLIEVMVSLGVMTIGAMAVIALQQQTVRSNIHARHMNMAMDLGQTWIERFKQDAHTWNQVGYNNMAPRPDGAAVLGLTRYLGTVMNNTDGSFRPIPVDADTPPFARYDIDGNGLAATDTREPFFCMSFRPTWVYYGRAIRIDLRVYWPRKTRPAPDAEDQRTGEAWFAETFAENCDGGGTVQADIGAANTTAAKNLHVLYLPTVVRLTPVLR